MFPRWRLCQGILDQRRANSLQYSCHVAEYSVRVGSLFRWCRCFSRFCFLHSRPCRSPLRSPSAVKSGAKMQGAVTWTNRAKNAKSTIPLTIWHWPLILLTEPNPVIEGANQQTLAADDRERVGVDGRGSKKSMQILITVRHDLCFPMLFHSAQRAKSIQNTTLFPTMPCHFLTLWHS